MQAAEQKTEQQILSKELREDKRLQLTNITEEQKAAAIKQLETRGIIIRKGVWNVCTIHRILRNQAYKGEAAFGKSKVGPIRKAVRARWRVRKRNYSVYRTDEENWIKITIPRIIEEELFDIVQKQLDENRKRSRIQRSGRRHLLQGLMVCQCCKYAYYAAKNAKGGRSYYRCTGTDASRFGGTRVCSNKSIRMEILEPVIWEEMKKVLKDTDKVAKEHQLMLLEHKNKQPNDEIEKEISKLEQGIKRLNYVYVRERITQEEYDLEAEEIEKKLKAMRNQKEEVVDEKELQREIDFIISSIKGFPSVVESELGQADWEAKLNIIRALVKRVEIDHDNIHIVFRFQELALAEMQKKNVQHYIRSPVLRNWRLIFNFLYYAHLMSSQHF